MDLLSISLIAITAILLVLYTWDRIQSRTTVTREIFLAEPQQNVIQITAVVKKNDVRELYLTDDTGYCTKVRF